MPERIVCIDKKPIAKGDKNHRLKCREKIEDIQSKLEEVTGSKRGDGDKINSEGLSEYLIGGAYTRVLKIPEDTLIVSELWTKERLWIILYGEVIVQTEFGKEVIKAPYIGKAPFGSKVALYTNRETLWCAVTGADCEALEEIEAEMIAKDYGELEYEWNLLEGEK